MNATQTTAQAPTEGSKESSATGSFFHPRDRIGRLRFIVHAVSIIYASLAAFLLLGLLLLTLDITPLIDDSGTTTGLRVLLASLFLLSGLVLCVPRAQRLHDLGLSGWWALAGLVPVLHLLVDIALAVVPGNKSANRYGPPPAANGTGTFIALAVLAVILVALVTGARWFIADQQDDSPVIFDEASCNSALTGGEASPECRGAAISGYAEAQYALGIMYEYGQAVERDDAQAVSWYRKAAVQGLATAQNSLGIMYDQGWGVEQDFDQAIKWYHLAALQSLADAQKNLGLMYAEGKGVDTNTKEAAAWFQLAATQGNPVAQYQLGLLYGEGRGVECNHAQSRRWIRRAAEQGLADAQRQVGQAPQCQEPEKTPPPAETPETDPELIGDAGADTQTDRGAQATDDQTPAEDTPRSAEAHPEQSSQEPPLEPSPARTPPEETLPAPEHESEDRPGDEPAPKPAPENTAESVSDPGLESEADSESESALQPEQPAASEVEQSQEQEQEQRQEKDAEPQVAAEEEPQP